MNEKLVSMGAQALHGDIAQNQRETTMNGFRKGTFSCLITTNVCARGVDIPEVDLVINCEPPSDVESYIHRSGRTGRAGKSGVCVTFYKSSQEFSVQNISKKAGVNFIKISAPQAKEIVAARALQTLDSLEDVHPEALSYFTSTAEEFLAKCDGDAIKALSMSLAMICNTTQPLPSRSLISSDEGIVTLLFRVSKPIKNVGYIRSLLQQSYSGLKFNDSVAWRMTKDSMGVIVDIVQDKVFIKKVDGHVQFMLAGVEWKDIRGITLEVCEELPELQEKGGSQSARGGFGGNTGRGGFGFGGQRGRGGSRGSFGRGRGRGGY